MRMSVQNLIKRAFQRLGIYTQYYPTPQRLSRHLEKRHQKVKEYEIKRITKTVAAFQDHKFYDAFLRLYIPEWNGKYQSAEFFGKGMGESSLDSYRKVKIDNTYFYEKVYFNNYPELNTVNWFAENVFPYLENEIKTANPAFYYAGDELTVLYFPFLDLKPIEDAYIEDTLIGFSKKLYKASNEIDISNLIKKTPEDLKDFKKHFLYLRNIKVAKKIFKDAGIDYIKVEEEIYHSQKILTHGDINEGNAFKNDILIDWDSFGLFPLGLEVAYLYYRVHLRLRNEHIVHYKDWLYKHYKDVVVENDWSRFERNYSYFLFIFTCMMLPENSNLQSELLKVLK